MGFAATAPNQPTNVGVGLSRPICSSYANGFLHAVLPYYAAAVGYQPNGMLTSVVHSGLAIGVTDTIAPDPNAMARPASISTAGATFPGTGLDGDWSTGTYGYDGSGNIKAMTHDALKTGDDAYVYDNVGRLRSATMTVGGGAHSQAQTFDVFGNITSMTTDGAPLSFDVGAATNRIANASYLYDGAGNLWQWPAGTNTTTATYDALNQMTSLQGYGISRVLGYDASGERVLIREGNAYTLTLRDLGGKVVREVAFDPGVPAGQQWSWKKDYVYRDGPLLASVSAAAGIHHYTLDHLGTPRLVTNRCGERVAQLNYAPFGQEIVGGNQDASERMRFTVHERDLGMADRTNDDLDYMHARYYSPTVGRFLAVDEGNASMQDPQSWNRYTYARANPIKNLEPNGRLWTSYHFLVTLAAARFEGRTWGQSLKLAATSAWVDFKSGSMAPDAAHTNIHAMIGTVNSIPQTPEAANRAIYGLVEQGIAGGTDTSLGTALHTVEDLATPLHAGHQWPKLWPLSPNTAMNLVAHTVGDDFPSLRTLVGAFVGSVAVLKADSSRLAGAVTLPPPKPLTESDCPVTVCREPTSAGQWMRQTPDGR